MQDDRIFPTDARFPDLSEPYASALREAVAFILGRVEQPLGILACGTIIRGNPAPSSDLDLYVIHAGRWRQRVQRFFNGVPAEIFINPPHQVERYLDEEQAEARPITAHMLVTGFAVVERGGQVDTLRRKARQSLAQPPPMDAFAQLTSRYMTATLYEDALDVAEAQPEAATLILNRAVYAMLHFALRRAGRFLSRDKDLLNDLAGLDAELGGLARAYFAAASLAERLSAAAGINQRTIAATGFFEWETGREDV